jgi:GAF domain-containing protein
MQKAPIPENEEERLRSLESLKILDTEREERFDKITKKALKDLDVPISTITLIDRDREWFKSCQGIEQTQADRENSFCGHALLDKRDVFIVEDTLKDSKFSDNPQVLNDPYIRFYAGIKLFNKKDNIPVGIFCIKDKTPRELSIEEIGKLMSLAKQAEEELNKK